MSEGAGMGGGLLTICAWAKSWHSPAAFRSEHRGLPMIEGEALPVIGLYAAGLISIRSTPHTHERQGSPAIV